jgi:hypothetical protein
MAGEAIYDVEWVDTSTLAIVFQPGTSVTLMSWQEGGAFRSLGRKGDGPGEFRSVRGVALADSNRIAVLDGTLLKVSFWTRSGVLVAEPPIEGPFVSGIWATDSGLIVGAQSALRAQVELLVVDPSQDLHRVIRRLPFGTDPSRSSCPFCQLGLGPDLSYVSLVADLTTYRLLRFDSSGDSVAPLERVGFERPDRTKEEFDSITAFRDQSANRLTGDAAQLLREAYRDMPISPKKDVFSGAPVVDEGGNVWVPHWTRRGSPTEVDVFDASGRYAATVTFPEGTTVYRVRSGLVLSALYSQSGEQSIREYQVPSQVRTPPLTRSNR